MSTEEKPFSLEEAQNWQELNTWVLDIVNERLASLMAAALADPDVDEHAKSLAGYLLERLTRPETAS